MSQIIYCMMAQDNCPEVIKCFERALPYVDHLILIDGGSRDQSIMYFRNWSRVEPKLHFYIHPWADDFSAQRTKYLRHADEFAKTGDFILVSDPDEIYDEDTFKNLRCLCNGLNENNNFNSAGFQCRAVSMRGPVRCHEHLDDYWKHLLYKWEPGMRYAGNPHESLVTKGGLRILKTPYIYEHIKQENAVWPKGCFPTGQRIFTDEGYKAVEEIKIGDRVIDKDGNLKAVTEVIQRDIDEEIVRISRYGSPDVLITKEHPIWVANAKLCNYDSKPIRYRPSLKEGHQSKGYECCQDKDFYYQNFAWLNAEDLNKRHIFHYPQLQESNREDLPPLEIFLKNCNQKAPKKELIFLTDSIFRFFGYYLAEGNTDHSRVELHFSVYERDSLVEDLEKIVTSEFHRALTIDKKKPHTNALDVAIACKDLAIWLDNVFDSGALNKKIPLRYLSGFTPNQKKELLKGLFLGDGTQTDFAYSLTLASPHLIMASWIMLVSLGFRPQLHYIPLETLNHSNGGIQHKHPMWRVAIPLTESERFKQEVLYYQEPYFTMKGRKKVRPSREHGTDKHYTVPVWHAPNNSVQSCSTNITSEIYRGLVYNIEVEDTHSYCLPYMTVHNCRNAFIGGGGPNLGQRNKHWIYLRNLCSSLGIENWHEFQDYCLKGNIDQRIKDEFIKYIDLEEICPGMTDGLSELREHYKTYYRIWHPEEERIDLRDRHIP